MDSKTPLVSVVTPFYNTDDYLEECIQSVLRQTYENWEYVLLNNFSTDKSAAIAEKYQALYPGKIRLEHNAEFLSQIANYNQVLRLISSQSKYCKFVQADDWLFPDCIASMVELADQHPSVGIVSAYQLDGENVQLDGLPYPSHEVSGRDTCRQYFVRDKYLFGTPTSLLLRSELVRSRDPFYKESYAPFEDAHACFELLRNWNFGFVHQVLTFSRRDNDSIIARIRAYAFQSLSRLQFVALHGRNYLSPKEYDFYLRVAEREYFVYLGKCVYKFERKDKDFWEFHRKGLATIGYKLNARLLAKWLPRALVEKIWEGLWGRWDWRNRVSSMPEGTR
ncbi:MAG TPA: glycosyltransferase family 2 protein [Terriglobales bacterium]|jgi:glycosyltransferase involved in cell wall biosynthesis